MTTLIETILTFLWKIFTSRPGLWIIGALFGLGRVNSFLNGTPFSEPANEGVWMATKLYQIIGIIVGAVVGEVVHRFFKSE